MSLKTRLIVAMLLILLGLGGGFVTLSNWSNSRYYQEVTQKLNAMIAGYVVAEERFFDNGEVNTQALEHVAHMAMVVNPVVEVYLLDEAGRILGHALPAEEVQQDAVGLEPLRRYLEAGGELRGPLLGDDPRSEGRQRVFSVATIEEEGEMLGYLYVVLGGKTYETVADGLRDSHILRLYTAAAGLLLLFAVLTGLLVFSFLTRRLRRLVQGVEEFSASDLHKPAALPADPERGDEIDFLAATFNDLSATVADQIGQLEQTDRTRRELIANVSHDLRTPIASMQGYIETLLMKHEALPVEERERYLQVASEHGQYLGKLVEDLFELSCLDSGLVQPRAEIFSMSELVQDVAQKYELQAAQLRIRLKPDVETGQALVRADIGMIQQVLENLIGNALKHTPASGAVSVTVAPSEDKVVTTVTDTGVGIPSDDLPHIFDRAYKASNTASSRRANAGLGLAIVKKILDLHNVSISVNTRLGRGSAFRFELPYASVQN